MLRFSMIVVTFWSIFTLAESTVLVSKNRIEVSANTDYTAVLDENTGWQYKTSNIPVLFFKNGTEIANLVRQNLKGMTNGTEEKNEKTVYT
jgi:hypothetical protein